MTGLLDRIFDLPKQQRMIILSVVTLVILALSYVFFYSDRATRIADLSDQVVTIAAERDKKKALVANLPKLTQQLQQLDGMLKEALAQLPERKEIPDLLSSISTKAKESGLEVLVFRPRAETPKEFYAEIPVDVIVKGPFQNLAAFFDEVGRLTRLVNMNNIELKNARATGEQMILEASTLATTFRFLDEAERARLAAAKTEKK